jgi:hypothetical protein
MDKKMFLQNDFFFFSPLNIVLVRFDCKMYAYTKQFCAALAALRAYLVV